MQKSFVEYPKIRSNRNGETPFRREDLIMALVNGMAFKRIQEMFKVNPASIYHYIEKSYEACLRFNANLEKRLSNVLRER